MLLLGTLNIFDFRSAAKFRIYSTVPMRYIQKSACWTDISDLYQSFFCPRTMLSSSDVRLILLHHIYFHLFLSALTPNNQRFAEERWLQDSNQDPLSHKLTVLTTKMSTGGIILVSTKPPPRHNTQPNENNVNNKTWLKRQWWRQSG